MFDLNEQMQSWRERLRAAETMRPADVDELEQHVHDAIAALTAKGLSEEEAFAVAIRRVGEPGPLVSEFRKVNGNHVWAQRAFWMIVGFLGFQIAGMVINAVAALGQIVVTYAGGGSVGIVTASVAASVACWLAIAVGVSRTYDADQKSPVAKLLSKPRWLLVAAAALVALLAKAIQLVAQMIVVTHLSHDDYAQSATWGALSSPVLCVLLFALLLATASRLRQATTRELAT